MSALILVVEDELQMAAVLEAYLQRTDARVEQVVWAPAARPDEVLPGIGGLDRLNTERMILVTARSAMTDRIFGRTSGPGHEVIGPCWPSTGLAQVNAARPRIGRLEGQVHRIDELVIDTRAVRARYGRHVLPFTPAEFRLTACLAAAPGRAFSRAELLATALPGSGALERVVDAHLASVRRKLEAAGGRGLLQTVRGVGYRLSDAGDPS